MFLVKLGVLFSLELVEPLTRTRTIISALEFPTELFDRHQEGAAIQ